ncbi:hypothetical protein FACS1894172_03580 [Spirochaetia bacterium]|nr:hypothetical protein FACS1894164_16150 [Spirochaetia bacterium]GHU30391.1 hypothetical protein FACS1894172_03580 [Spirochaetia bacterium]
MNDFNAFKPWVILAASDNPAALKMAKELSQDIDLLRRQEGGSSVRAPDILSTSKNAPKDSIIVLNSRTDVYERNGFSWRLGPEQIEVYGDSDRGLCNGVFDFLCALGFQWPAPGEQIVPKPLPGERGLYKLKVPSNFCPSGTLSQKRLIFNRHDSWAMQALSLRWAARNKIDTVVFSLHNAHKQPKSPLGHLSTEYAFTVERGGWDMSLLLPRWHFFFNHSMFRMDSGVRDWKHNFCPTDPYTLRIIQKEAEKIFRLFPETKVYHLWPDRGFEQQWCSCPTCRAFTVAEQNRIACNAAADVLLRVNPEAKISFYEHSAEETSIKVRPNLFKISIIPGETGAEGWVSAMRPTF